MLRAFLLCRTRGGCLCGGRHEGAGSPRTPRPKAKKERGHVISSALLACSRRAIGLAVGYVSIWPASFGGRTQKSTGRVSRRQNIAQHPRGVLRIGFRKPLGSKEPFLEMKLKHDTGAMRGRVLNGKAQAAGSTKTNWHAYLSTTEPGGAAGVNARDRIGKGPWQNAKGVVVAKNVEDLHSNYNNINKQTALTEKGEIVSGRGDMVNMHDILTGSDPQGALFHGRWRHHLRKLDEERRRISPRGPSRPHRPQRHEAHELLELLAWLARLQPG
jgi:hypothetical protein